jgi:hypothetical protein
MASFTPRPLYPQGNSPWYPLDRRLGGPQSQSGHGGEEKNSQTSRTDVQRAHDAVWSTAMYYELQLTKIPDFMLHLMKSYLTVEKTLHLEVGQWLFVTETNLLIDLCFQNMVFCKTKFCCTQTA